jgi:ankyrin repeat protein
MLMFLFYNFLPSGYNDIVTVLLEQGALVSATDHNSSTPLHLACQKGHQKCTVSKREGGRKERI